MGSKIFLLLGLSFAVVLLISSEVAARELVENSQNTVGNQEVYGYGGNHYHNGGGSGSHNGDGNGGGSAGHNGGGNGDNSGYHNGGGSHHGGGCHLGYCHHRCCKYAGEVVTAEEKPQN